MDIVYKRFSNEFLENVIELEKQWVDEDITYGVVPLDKTYFLETDNKYFFLALNDNKAVGYIIAEVIIDNEYNIFPNGSSYLRVNDIYVLKEYRKREIGDNLLKIVEKEAENNGIKHLFISTATKDSDSVIRFYKKNGYNIWTTSLFKSI